MPHLTRSSKGERWRIAGEGIFLAPGDKIELRVGGVWVLTEILWSHNTKDYRCGTMGLYMYDGQPARLAK